MTTSTSTRRRSVALSLITLLSTSLVATAAIAPAEANGASGTVTGTVTLNGAPVAEAVFITLDDAVDVDAPEILVETDSEGFFTVADVAFGTWRIVVNSPPAGYQFYFGDEFEVSEATSPVVENVDLQPYPTGSGAITATIVDSESTEPVVGATVDFSGAGGAADSSDVTGVSGVVTFGDLPNGVFSVTVSASGYVSVTRSVAVVDGETTEVVVELQLANAAVTGTVLDESDNPIEGIWVAVTTPDGEDYLAGVSTDAAGMYLIEDLAAGSVSILVGGIGTSWVETATPTTLLADQTVTVNFVLTPRMTGAVSGTVVDGETLGIDKMCGTVYDTTSGDVVAGFPETDSSGAFYVDNLDIGTYTLLFWDCDFLRSPAYTTVFLGDAVSIDSATAFTVSTGNTAELGAVTLTPGATISGTVRLRAGTDSIALPASRGVDALLYVLDGSTWTEFPDPSPFVSAGGPGEYQVSGLPEATYRVALGDPATGVKAYTRVYWEDALDFDDATNISVVGTTAITGIDAIVEVAQPGYQPTPISTESLTADVAGDVSTPNDDLTQNQNTDVEVGDEFAGEWVSIWGHSTPVQMGGWVQVGADGTVTVPVPTSLPAGAHQLAAQDAEGTLIGWTDVSVIAADLSGGGLPSTGLDRDSAILLGMLAVALLSTGAALVVARSRKASSSSKN